MNQTFRHSITVHKFSFIVKNTCSTVDGLLLMAAWRRAARCSRLAPKHYAAVVYGLRASRLCLLTACCRMPGAPKYHTTARVLGTAPPPKQDRRWGSGPRGRPGERESKESIGVGVMGSRGDDGRRHEDRRWHADDRLRRNWIGFLSGVGIQSWRKMLVSWPDKPKYIFYILYNLIPSYL
jgi:hypothetical protein